MAGIETDGWHLILPAARMGLKQYVPAYLGTELSDSDLLTGVSFASGGCGFDPLTAEIVVSVQPCPGKEHRFISTSKMK